MAFSMGVHGNAVVVEHTGSGTLASGGALLPVAGIPGSDVVGLPQGWGKTFRGKAGHYVWFHLPVPQPYQVENTINQPRYVYLNIEMDTGVHLAGVNVWTSNRRRLVALDRVEPSGGQYKFTIPENMGTAHGAAGISISMLVNFASEGNVVFLGATVDSLGL